MTAKFMGISHDLPPALKPGADASRGASFAVDSATILGTPKDSVSFIRYIYRYIVYYYYNYISHNCHKLFVK